MIEIIKFLNIGEWAVAVLIIVSLWKWVVKSLVEKWFQNKLDLQKQAVGSALQIQKDLAIKKAEFEKIKLERVLLLLEEINTVASEHKMMQNTHSSLIVNKGGLPESFEAQRVLLDTKMITALSSIAIYLPVELRSLVNQLRKIISCSWKEPLQTYYLLLEKGTINCVSDVCSQPNDLYNDLLDCFYDMCNKYLGLVVTDESYKDILKRHKFSDSIKPISPNPAQHFLWQYLLLHEYVSIAERSEVIANIEKAYEIEKNRD